MPRRPLTHAQRMAALRAPPPEDRPSAAARGYDRRWRRLRLLKLNAYPLCEAPGCCQPATDVDHIVAKAKGGDDSLGNLRSLCHRHHSAKTYREDGAFGRRPAPPPEPV